MLFKNTKLFTNFSSTSVLAKTAGNVQNSCPVFHGSGLKKQCHLQESPFSSHWEKQSCLQQPEVSWLTSGRGSHFDSGNASLRNPDQRRRPQQKNGFFFPCKFGQFLGTSSGFGQAQLPLEWCSRIPRSKLPEKRRSGKRQKREEGSGLTSKNLEDKILVLVGSIASFWEAHFIANFLQNRVQNWVQRIFRERNYTKSIEAWRNMCDPYCLDSKAVESGTKSTAFPRKFHISVDSIRIEL